MNRLLCSETYFEQGRFMFNRNVIAEVVQFHKRIGLLAKDCTFWSCHSSFVSEIRPVLCKKCDIIITRRIDLSAGLCRWVHVLYVVYIRSAWLYVFRNYLNYVVEELKDPYKWVLDLKRNVQFEILFQLVIALIHSKLTSECYRFSKCHLSATVLFTAVLVFCRPRTPWSLNFISFNMRGFFKLNRFAC
jgi:hypothetical protein